MKGENLIKEENLILTIWESVRIECQNSIGHRNQIISFGLGALAVLFAGGLVQKTPPRGVAILVFSISIPSVSVAVLYIWLGELQRMIRADWFLVLLEDQISSNMTNPALFKWHTWVIESKTQMKFPHLAVIILFLGLAFLAPKLGQYAVTDYLREYWAPLFVPWFVLLCVAVDLFRRLLKLVDHEYWRKKLPKARRMQNHSLQSTVNTAGEPPR